MFADGIRVSLNRPVIPPWQHQIRRCPWRIPKLAQNQTVAQNREAICVARRVKKSAPLLTACTVFGVAFGDPIFPLRKVFLRPLLETELMDVEMSLGGIPSRPPADPGDIVLDAFAGWFWCK